MKILLIGEFSGLHNNLRDGLVELGHEVTLASHGDGWKQFSSDINLNSSKSNGMLGKIERNLSIFSLLQKAEKFDVCQLISYKLTNILLNTYFLKKILIKNKNLFVLVAGASPTVTNYSLEHFEYSPYHIDSRNEEEHCKYMQRIIKHRKKISTIKYELKILSSFKKVIPTSYSYRLPFEGLLDNLYEIIPMPINTKKYKPHKSFNKNLSILYGINRKCDKGHYYIMPAIERLQKEKIMGLSFDIITQLPFPEYLNHLNSCDILIDQCKSSGYGMNGLLGLAMGKIVFSGSEKKAMDYMGFSECPVINITPNTSEIYNKLTKIIYDPKIIETIKKSSRSHAEKYHDYIIVARKFLSAWEKE